MHELLDLRPHPLWTPDLVHKVFKSRAEDLPVIFGASRDNKAALVDV